MRNVLRLFVLIGVCLALPYDFAAACGFQEGRGGDRVRYIRSVDPGEFWKFVEEESREEESPCR